MEMLKNSIDEIMNSQSSQSKELEEKNELVE